MPLRKEEPTAYSLYMAVPFFEHYARIHFTIRSRIQQGCGCGKIRMSRADCKSVWLGTVGYHCAKPQTAPKCGNPRLFRKDFL